MLKVLTNYNMTVVCHLLASLSINDDYQTFVLHHSIIEPRTVVCAAIVVHYFSVRTIIHFSPRNWFGVSQSNILLEELTKYKMTVVRLLMSSLSINDNYQTFVFHQLIIVQRTIDGAAKIL